MTLRLRTKDKSPAAAGAELKSALGHLMAACSRWLSLQPVAREMPVYAERARRTATRKLRGTGSWATRTTSRARRRGSHAASATRTAMINVALAAALVWWTGRRLTRDAG